MVHGAVAGLRRTLEPDRRGSTCRLLVTHGGGYALDIHREQLDTVRFEQLLTKGRRLVDTAPDQASRALVDALSLWRGPALAGIAQAFARDAAARLDELRLECIELRMQADLTLGHHHDVVADLEALVAHYPPTTHSGNGCAGS